MIRWVAAGGDLRGYLGELQDYSFAIGISSSPDSESALVTLLPGYYQTDFHADIDFLQAKADSVLRMWMKDALLHCASCDMHSCEE